MRIGGIGQFAGRAGQEYTSRSLKSDHFAKQDALTAAGRDAKEAAETSAKAHNAAEYDAAEYDAVSLRALSEADLEKAMLAYFRTLSTQERPLAVKLIRELARDEREARSQVVV